MKNNLVKFIWIFIFILAIFQYRLWFTNTGILSLWKNSQIHNNLITKSSLLNKQIYNLNKQIGLFSKYPQAYENDAREILGLIGKGETFHHTVEKNIKKK